MVMVGMVWYKGIVRKKVIRVLSGEGIMCVKYMA